jgi:hypothetical protein
MSEKPPLTDSEIYERLHEAWLVLNSAKGATHFGDNTLKAARTSLFTLQAAILKKIDEAKDPTES